MEQRKSTSPIRLGYKAKSVSLSDLDENLGKLPPQALDLEEVVLGALMLEKDALSTVIDILKPESFYKDAWWRRLHLMGDFMFTLINILVEFVFLNSLTILRK